jgi:hypothetical protein
MRYLKNECRPESVAKERLPVIEHQTVIQPSSQAIHHKPVFLIVHVIYSENKITETFCNYKNTSGYYILHFFLQMYLADNDRYKSR